MDVIILMAGQGKRLNAGMNKALLDLNGKPIFMYSLEALAPYASKIILVINPLEENLIKPYINDKVELVYGGAERYLSVFNGLLKTSSDYVLIHDAARPNFNINKLNELLEAKENYDGLFLATTEKNTTYLEINGKLKEIPRSNLVLASTPQILKRNIYLKAVNKAKKDSFIPTDDISLLLHLDENARIKYIIDEDNFKITRANDLALARMVVKNA